MQLCCTLLGLSRSGFYAWRKRPAKLISAQELKLYYTAKDLFGKSRESLGSRELMDVFERCYGSVLTPNNRLGDQFAHDNGLNTAVATPSILAT